MFGLALVVFAGQAGAAEGVAVQGEAMPPRAQSVSAPETPRLVRLGAIDTTMVVALPAADEEQRAAMEEDPGIGPMRIGFHREPPVEYQGDLTPSLRWVPDPWDGSISAAVRVSSPGALRVRLAVRARLPPGAEIRFFHGAPPAVVGTMGRDDFAGRDDADNASESEVRWSPSVEGDAIGMEITLPSSDARGGTRVEIRLVSHQYRPLRPARSTRSRGAGGGDASSSDLECSHVDIQCREVGSVANAVAKITYEVPGKGPFMCSGTLMNDDDPSTIVPYFLTARHCISKQSVADTLEAYWFYQSDYCGSDFATFVHTSPGADLLETSKPQDSTLLRLGGRPPDGVWYSGWHVGTVGVDWRAYGVHHPGGYEKKYVEGITGPAMDVPPIGCGPHDPDDTCIELRRSIPILPDDGAVEPGSSGSGLFRDEYLVGVLSVVAATPEGRPLCSNAYYGRFSDFYPEVRPWLHREGLGEVAVAPTELRVREGGAGAYELRLQLKPTATVTVQLSVTGDDDLSASHASVSFAPSNWTWRRRVRVYASEDRDQDNGVATIKHRVSSRDIAYDGIAVDAVSVTERDNDLRLDRVTGVAVRAPDDPGTLEVRWNAVAGADSYIVEWRTDRQQFASGRRRVVTGGATATTLEELDEDVVYFVRVIAVSGGVLLDSPPSESVSARTAMAMRSFFRGWRLKLLESEATPASAIEQ